MTGLRLGFFSYTYYLLDRIIVRLSNTSYSYSLKRLVIMKNFIFFTMIVLLAGCSSNPTKTISAAAPAVTNVSSEKQKEQEASFCTGVLYVAANWLAGISHFNAAEEMLYVAEVFYSSIEGNKHAESEALRAADLAKKYLYSSSTADKESFEDSVSMCIDIYNSEHVK